MSKVMLITGGSRGIGAATALLAAHAGYAVAVNYTSNSLAADEVVRQIRQSGGQAISVQADVAQECEVLAMFEKVDAKFGRLTALVNNAGVVDQTARVDEMSVARLKRMFDINVIGTMVCAREAVKRMSTRYGGAGGAIVNVSSAAARLGAPRHHRNRHPRIRGPAQPRARPRAPGAHAARRQRRRSGAQHCLAAQRRSQLFHGRAA